MASIIAYFQSLGLDFYSLLYAAGLLLVGTIVLGAIGRFVFGKKSVLVNAVSSAIGILFVYALNIVLHSAGGDWQKFITPLPFITVTGDKLRLFSFAGADYTVICSQLVSMIILAFLMNLIDNFMPKGKNLFTWSFFRILTVLLAQAAHILVTWLLESYLPEGSLMYAPAIVLALLLILLLTGALKILVGALLTTVNPLIAAFYTFFFANVVGKQVTKAVLTTGLLAALVYALGYFGITSFTIAMGALIAYIPLAVILLILWFLVGKLF